MYRSAHHFPSLVNRPKDERTAIIRAALKEHGRAYSMRFFLVLLAGVIGIVTFDRSFAAGVSPTDWRWWLGKVVGGALIYVYLLWEINGAVYRAVEKYLAGRGS